MLGSHCRCLRQRRRWRRSLLSFVGVLLLVACTGDDAAPAGNLVPGPAGPVATDPDDHQGHEHVPAGDVAGLLPADPEPTRYVCPMHPHIVSDAPGQCPICGMNLVARSPAAVAAPTDPIAAVTLSPNLQQGLGVRIGHPRRRTIAPVFRVAARVVPDARGVVRVAARSDGFVERLHVRAVGDPVRRGAVLAELYSPELVQAQEELLFGDDGAAGARERLRRLGVADRDIDAISADGESRRRLPLRSPVDGVVAELGAREGGAVAAGETVLEVAPRSQVWIEAMLFPQQRLQLGPTVPGRFTLPGHAGAQWHAQASYIAPAVDPVTQTLAVRFPIGDAGDALPLGVWLDAEITGATRDQVLVVPVSALIRSSDGARVVRRLGADRFMPVAVDVGVIHGDDAEIVSGLSVDDVIVLSGQFLLDSEAELRSGLRRLQVHDHGDGQR